VPSKEARYADALAEDLYTKSKTDLPDGTDYAIVKGPTGTRIPIPRNGEDDESWHERIKNWQDRGVLVDWKGPAAEKMRTPEAKVVAVEDAQPDGEMAFRQANKKLIDEREAKDIDSARGAGIKSQAEALKQKGIPYIFNDEGLFIPRGRNMTDEQWQAAKDAAAKKFTSISVWDGPDKEPDADADERVASGSGGSKFDQLRKAMSSLFTNAVPEGASPAFQQGYQDAQSVGQNYTPANASQSVEPPKKTNAEVSKEHGEQVGNALLDSAPGIINPAAGAMNTLAIPEVSKALQYGVAGAAAATNPLPGLQAAGHFLVPNLIPSPLAQQDATADAIAAVPAAPGAAPQMPLPPQPEAPQGSSDYRAYASAGAGPGIPNTGVFSSKEYAKRLAEDTKQQQDAALEMAKNEKKFNQSYMNELEDADREMARRQIESEEITQRVQQDKQKRLEAMDKTLAEMQAPAAIDPDHYWKVRDTSQKVASVLAAFFSGGSTLASMHAAINRDVAAQEATAHNLLSSNKQKLESMQNTYLLARQNGLDALQANAVAKMDVIDKVKRRAEMIAAYSADANVQARAQAVTAAMDQELVKTQQSWAHQDGILDLKNKEQLQDYYIKMRHLALAGREQRMREQAAPGPQLAELGKLQSNADIVADLRKRFGEKGIISRVWDKLMANVPMSAQDEYNRRAKDAVYAIAPTNGSGVLSPKELEEWFGNVIPKSGNLSGEAMLKSLEEQILNKKMRIEQSLNMAGRYTDKQRP
jgi:hypothetical protein